MNEKNDLNLKPLTKPVRKPVRKLVKKKLVKKSVKKLVKKPVKKPLKKPLKKKLVKKPIEKLVKKPIKKPLEKLVNKPIKKTVKKPIKKIVKKPVKKLIKKQVKKIIPKLEIISEPNLQIYFSIVIPCHPPHFKYLDRLIKQINNFKIEDNYNIKEIIISASETIKINIKETSIYPIIIYPTLNKCNAAKNRNRVWDIVNGTWIVFLDADDFYHPDKLSVTYNSIYKNQDIDCIIHSYKRGKDINENFLKKIEDNTIVSKNEIFKKTFPDGKWKVCNPVKGGYNIKFPIKYNFFVAQGIATVRKTSNIRYNEKLFIGEDGHFCRQHVFKNKLIVISACLMIYT
jgi:hypothetical protein